jgi:CarD family transcriptional regulator
MTTAKKTSSRREAQPTTKASPPKKMHAFEAGQNIVYPAHGVGRVVEVSSEVIAGFDLELYVIHFEKERMTLRAPVNRAEKMGMRPLATTALMDEVMDLIAGRAKIKRTMWSRRAQEYEAKINSGDILSVAEVVRDLYKPQTTSEQSYSERQIYEMALARLVPEAAIVMGMIEPEAQRLIEEAMTKSVRRSKAASKTDAANSDLDDDFHEEAA